VAAVAWLSWTRSNADLRNATVCATALISTPYVLDYDFVVLLPALAFLWRDGERNGVLAGDRSMMALVWAAPIAARQIAEFSLIPLGLITASIVAAIALRRSLVRASPSRR
jgi:hypothetical protein